MNCMERMEIKKTERWKLIKLKIFYTNDKFNEFFFWNKLKIIHGKNKNKYTYKNVHTSQYRMH